MFWRVTVNPISTKHLPYLPSTLSDNTAVVEIEIAQAEVVYISTRHRNNLILSYITDKYIFVSFDTKIYLF